MNRANALALGLSTLVVGAVASTARAASTTGAARPIPPSTARRAFAARDGVIVRAGPASTTPEVARLGRGSAVRVAGEEDLPGSGFLPIVREWVDGGARFARNLGWIAAVDLIYTDPRPRALTAATGLTPPRPPSLTPGTQLVLPIDALPTTRSMPPSLLSTPPIQITMGMQGGNVHVVVERIEAPNRVVATIVGVESTSDIGYQRPRLIPIQPGVAITFDPSRARPVQMSPPVGADPVHPPGDRSDGGECDLFFTMTWPSSVDHFKERLDTVFQATDKSIEICAAFPAADREEWNIFHNTWRTFRSSPTPTFGSGGHWDQTCAYARTLDGWRRRLAQTACQIVGPVDIRGYVLPGGVEASIGSAATIVKWSALTLGGAVLLATFYPEIRAALGVGRQLYGRKRT